MILFLGRIFIILILLTLLIPTVRIDAKRYVRWEKDSQERIGLATPPRKKPGSANHIIFLIVGAIVFFLLVHL